jgi:anti-sigma factor RsiW
MSGTDRREDTYRREEDVHAVARYVDGEMAHDDRVAFESRLAADPGLASEVEELAGLRRMFAPERVTQGPAPSSGFRARVLAEVAGHTAERGPERETFDVFCRRIVVAAALLFGLGVLVFAGLLRRADTGRLEASPAEIHKEMDRLDALIRARAPR